MEDSNLIVNGKYTVNSKNKPRGLYFSKTLLEVTLPLLLCFTLYLRAIFQVLAPRGAYIWRGDLTEGFFCVTGLGGLYLEGLIHGGAYFRNFTIARQRRYQLIACVDCHVSNNS